MTSKSKRKAKAVMAWALFDNKENLLAETHDYCLLFWGKRRCLSAIIAKESFDGCSIRRVEIREVPTRGRK